MTGESQKEKREKRMRRGTGVNDEGKKRERDKGRE
jgi:hypothetical protein